MSELKKRKRTDGEGDGSWQGGASYDSKGDVPKVNPYNQRPFSQKYVRLTLDYSDVSVFT
jgi:hypothetical protein